SARRAGGTAVLTYQIYLMRRHTSTDVVTGPPTFPAPCVSLTAAGWDPRDVAKGVEPFGRWLISILIKTSPSAPPIGASPTLNQKPRRGKGFLVQHALQRWD